MSSSFTKCSSCGKIFAASEHETLCPSCRGEARSEGPRDLLRKVKDYIRDMQARGEFVTIGEAAKGSGVDETVVWNFIQSGEIDLTPFDDPQVRNFLINKRREQEKLKRDERATETKTDAKPSGFHGADKDDRGR